MGLNARGAMGDPDLSNYKLSKTLLSYVGLWPYDTTWLVYAKRGFMMMLVVSSIVLLVLKCSESILINTVSYLILVFVFLLKYSVFWYKDNDIKELIEMVQRNWQSLNNEDEQQIIAKYENKGKTLNTIFTIAIYLSASGFTYLTVTKPSALTTDICESSRNLYITIDYVTDNEIYLYITLIQFVILLVSGATTVLGTETAIIMCAYHASGLFQVVCYRVQNALSDKVSDTSNTKKDSVIYKNLIEVVELHNQTLKSVSNRFYATEKLRVVVRIQTDVTINLLHLSDIITSSNGFEGLVLEVPLIQTIFAYLFLSNHMGQIIMDSSADIFTEVYTTRWYNAPLSSQKLLLNIMHHAMKAYTFSLGGITAPNYEGFSTMIHKYRVHEMQRINNWKGKLLSWRSLRSVAIQQRYSMNRLMWKYYKLSATMLSITGLWPYTKTNIRRFQNCIASIAIGAPVILLFITVIRKRFTLPEFVPNLTVFVISIVTFCKYFTFWYYKDTIKGMLEEINNHWTKLGKDELELEILNKYANAGKRYGMIFSLMLYPIAVISIVFHFSSKILDILAPLNESRPHFSYIQVEYFVDQEKYFYPIAIFQNMMFLFGVTVLVATEAINTMCIQHIASLFEITSHRIEKAVLQCSKETLITAVIIHAGVIKFNDTLMITFATPYFLLLVFSVVSLSLMLFWLSQSIALANDIEQTLIPLIFVFTTVGYIWGTNYVLQKLLDCGNDILSTLYTCEWYRTALDIQKMLLMMMLNNNRIEMLNKLITFKPSMQDNKYVSLVLHDDALYSVKITKRR
ncbi:unnamed protein product [Xylocopa violacea]|uniref:Odorant receptor n=1 Tax=Xylocopa violacea TaxID=135666 RepID=A0ABP1MZ70_XYLVO